MEINGSHTFQAPRDVVWPMLQDPEVLANVMPGCESLEMVEENKYEGILKIKVGPVQGKFKGTVTLSNIQAPESYNIEVKGRGPAGIINGKGTLNLNEDEATCVMAYEGTAQVQGRIATVGQRLIDTSARAIIRQSLEELDKQVLAKVEPPASVETTQIQPTPPVAAPTQTEFAVGVAKNFMEELVPEEQRGDVMNKALLFFRWFIPLSSDYRMVDQPLGPKDSEKDSGFIIKEPPERRHTQQRR